MTSSRVPWLAAFTVAVVCVAGGAGYLALGEVPTAIIKGKVVAEDTGRALPGVTIQLHGVTMARTKAGPEIVFHSREDGTFRARRVPAGGYTVEASTEAHALHRSMFVLTEGEVRTLTLELPPVPPYLEVQETEHVFLPEETPEVTAHGFVQEEALQFRFFRVDMAKLFTEHGGELYSMLYRDREPAKAVLEKVPGLTAAGQHSAPILRRDVEGVFHERFELPLHQPGLYVVETSAGPARALAWVMVTRLALVVKHAGPEALAYVADLKTGAPVAGARVAFSTAGKARTSGVTGEDGTVQVKLPATSAPSAGDEEEGGGSRFMAWAEQGGSQAFLSYWGSASGPNKYRVYSYTDRPVYRPGHEAFFNGIARSVQEVGYGVPRREPVAVEIRDPRDTLVYRSTLTTDGYGTFHDQFSLSEEAATGYYTLATTIEGERSESGFKVAEYRKPEFKVEVKPDKPRYTRGETMEVTVSAQYYFGAPVAGAEVTYRVTRAPYYYYPAWEQSSAAEEGGGDEGDGSDSGALVEEGTARTDDQGIAHISIGTRPRVKLGEEEHKQAEEEDRDQRFAIGVTISEAGGREVTETRGAIVTQGEFAVEVAPGSWIGQPGKPVTIGLTARTYEGAPVAQARIALVAQPERWTGGQVKYGEETELSAVTDVQGKGRASFTPRRAGYYRLQATTTDRLGNRIRARSFLWVTSEAYGDFEVRYPDLEIIPDKRMYEKGETATLLINTQHVGATALFTIEGPRVFEHRLIELKAKSTRLTVPIRAEYAPNVYAAVALVQGKQFATQEARLMVSVAERNLTVEVQPNKSRYAPGELATYSLLTRDAAGRPVPAQASIGVVDESIYAVQEEMTPPIRSFFYEPRGNSVETVYSFPSFYLDANKETVGIKVRKRFADTAYWNPTVITGADGRASVSFTMQDTLTTWRATTRAVTLNTEVGQSVVKVVTAKDLMVRLEVPRFFTQNDQVTMAAVVHNQSSSEQELQLWVRAPGLTFNGSRAAPRADSFRLSPGKVYRREWQIEVPTPGPKEITVYTKAKSGLSDAMALTLPAVPHGREQAEWRSGSVTDTAVERFTVRQDAVAGAGELRVRVAPSLGGVVFGALDYLASYPYGCTEQTMSSFLPDVIVGRTLRELKLSNAKLEKSLPDMVRRGLDRLYGYQHDDGGWGWWRYDKTDAWMTAYVVYGLLLARQNGFSVNESALNRGVDQLVQLARQVAPPLEPQSRAFVAQVLAMAGKREAATPLVNDLARQVDRLDSATLARVTLTLLALRRPAEAKAVGTALWARATESGALVWWPETGPSHGEGAAGSAEVTALAFQALDALFPNDPRVPKAVRWLVLHRRGNAWDSTRDTAAAIYAITGYLRRTQELKPDYEAKVQLGARVLLARRITAADVYGPEIEVRVPLAELARGANALRFTKAGAGNLYYTVALTQYLYQEDMKAVIGPAGPSVERQYFRVRSGKDPRTGWATLIPYSDATTDLRLAESVLVRVTVHSSRPLEYMMIEDPLPAGAEAQERGDVERWEWSWWYSDMEVRDEKVTFFARNLPAGRSVFEYYLRPQFGGRYHVMPTVASNMYAPDVRGVGSETRVEVR